MNLALHTSDRIFFVPKKSDIIKTLFNGPVTASGIYKVKPKGIMFFDLKGEPQAFLVANQWGQRFFVDCWRAEVKGKRRLTYHYCTTQSTQKFLGIEGLSCTQQHELGASLWNQIQQPCTV